MDRSLFYDNEILQTVDLLNIGKFAMVGQAFQNAAMLGTSTVVAGLSCVPTGPASLQVVVNEGSIYQLDETDATADSDLGTDTNNIMKQGILIAPTTLTITPPATSGFSQVFLVEAELADVDTGSTVLNYFNSTNPSEPFSGPGNAGTPNFTIRACHAVISLKAGIAATTGTQTTPSPDSGFVGLFSITVPNGATAITSGMIVQLPTAPFFPTLPQIPAGVQSGEWTFGVDTGTANNLGVALNPIPAAYTTGMSFNVKTANAPTGASVINANTLGNKSIVKSGAAPLTGSEWASGDIITLDYDGTNMQLLSFRSSGTLNASQLVGGAATVRLSASLTTAGASVTLTADGIGVATVLGGAGIMLASYSQTLNTATTGAGGMDTGAAPTSGFLSIYAIYNPTTKTASILGTSASQTMIYGGTNMPAGFTMSALISVWPTNASHLLIAGNVIDREFYYAAVPPIVLNNGTATTSTAVSLTSVVPVAARACYGQWSATETSSVTANSEAFYSTLNLTNSGIIRVTSVAVGGQNNIDGWLPINTSQTIFYNVGQSTLDATIFINGYRI
jgi:hypothetical protein